MGEQAQTAELLASAGSLLLEYNECAGNIHRALASTAQAICNERLELSIHYGGVLIALGDDPPQFRPTKEFRYNAALQANVHSILRELRLGIIDPPAALTQIKEAEATTPRHPRTVAVVVLGIAAAALAAILGADFGACMVGALSTALGLFVRQELGRRHFSLLTQPLVAAFIGAVCGGIAHRFGWTRTPGLALIVPALMLVPGPHLINGLLELIDNYLPMSMARLSLAMGILFASALGIILGMELTFLELAGGKTRFDTEHLNVFSDMLLAGIVTCGFATFYNASWSQIAMAIIGGMVGHSLRYVALEAGFRLEVATLAGGLGVGVVSGFIALRYSIPFAVIAFAGAASMMPGMQMYQAIGGALQLAHAKSTAAQPLIAATLGNAMQASFAIGALALGLIVGTRITSAFRRGR